MLLKNLYDTYGKITPESLDSNDATLRSPFVEDQPIESYFEGIEDAWDFADAGNQPYDDSITINVILNDFQKNWQVSPHIKTMENKTHL